MSMIDLPDSVPDVRRVRLFMAFVTLGLIAILARLWYLQVAHGAELEEASIVNQRRLIRRVPPRGQIEDRFGHVLATNRPEIVVSIVPYEIKRSPEALSLLADLLNRPLDDLAGIVDDQYKIDPFGSVHVDKDVDMATVTRIEEQRLSLPGVYVGPEPVRSYPDRELCGHILGQMGQITPEELKAGRKEGYRPGDSCGKLGLERAFDAALRGTNGGREVEVDARGRMRGEVDHTDPIPGATLTLTIDKTLQKIGYDELAAKQKPGAVVALDPQTGAVLALVSYPSYDPNLYVRGISRSDLLKLNEDPRKPQINRAVGSRIAPGSTFKLITAIAGLETGHVTPHSSDYCSGSISLGHWTKRCHKPGGHGYVELNDAIARSCDVFFYHLGQRLGPEVIAEYARKFGLGHRTGIDLPRVETAGIVPDPAYKRAHHQVWVGGDTVDYAIGQSALGCTPLQMCNVAAAIANGGTLYRPQLVKTITQYNAEGPPQVVHRMAPEVIHRAGVSPATLDVVVHAMESVMEPGGTGATSAIPGLRIAGKTGTAQRYHHPDNAWFVGFAPVEHPRIAICVFVEEGGHGGVTAAPIARKLFAQFFHLKLDSSGGAGDTWD